MMQGFDRLLDPLLRLKEMHGGAKFASEHELDGMIKHNDAT